MSGQKPTPCKAKHPQRPSASHPRTSAEIRDNRVPSDITSAASPKPSGASMQRFRGKVTVVTGAGQGAGRTASILFAREGASVVVNDIDAGAAQSVVGEIIRSGGGAVSDAGDVSTVDGAEGVVARAVETFGGLDILVNVRLVSCDLPLVETTSEDFDHLVRHTLKGAFMPPVSPACNSGSSAVGVSLLSPQTPASASQEELHLQPLPRASSG